MSMALGMMKPHRKARRSVIVLLVASMLLLAGGSALFPSLSRHPRPRLHRCGLFWCLPTSTTAPQTTSTNRTSTTVKLPESTTTSTIFVEPTSTTTSNPVGCVGVPLVNGQSDINANPAGTRFCVAGLHNWSLVPKTGQTFVGGVLDGGGQTQYAFQGSAANVTLDGMEVRNFRPANQQGAIAAVGSGWTLRNLQVHDNGSVGNGEKWTGPIPSGGGGGSTLGNGWLITGGRYFNNRQWGIGGGGSGSTVDGVEVDHNNFTDSSYSKRNIDCDFEAGGLKWVNDNLTVRNSKVHDNACRGIWADLTANNATITGNQVYNNWADGIMVEVSSGAKVLGNTVSGNGYREWAQPTPTACSWMYGAGIFLSTSSNIEVAGNTVTGNCRGITGGQENRGAQYPKLTGNQIHDNVVSGGGFSGMAAADGSSLAGSGNVWTSNQFINGATFCGFSC